MILYLDTSSLVKLYVEEDFSDKVRDWVGESEAVATCRVAYPEACSAFNRRLRSGDLSEQDYGKVIKRFHQDWKAIVAVDFDEVDAGDLVDKYGLRGFDAVHLSSAKLIRFGNGKEGIEVVFSSFDQKLNLAAAGEGFEAL